jgi:hypothetical protein
LCHTVFLHWHHTRTRKLVQSPPQTDTALEDLEVLEKSNLGKHLALPYKGFAEKPCVLSNRGSPSSVRIAKHDLKDPDLQCKSQGSRSPTQKASGDWLKGDPQVGRVNVYQ